MAPSPRLRQSSRRGQALIETAVVLLAFVSIFLTLFDFGRMWATYQLIQNNTREAARFGTTGRRYGSLDRAASIKYAVNRSGDTAIPSNDIVLEYIHDGARSSGPGGSFDVLIVSASQQIPIYSPWLQMAFGHTFAVRAQVAARNEDLDSIDYPTLATTSTTSTTYVATTTTTGPTTTTLTPSSTAPASTTTSTTETTTTETTTSTTESSTTSSSTTSTTAPSGGGSSTPTTSTTVTTLPPTTTTTVTTTTTTTVPTTTTTTKTTTTKTSTTTTLPYG